MGSYYTKFPLSQCTDYTVSLPHVEDNLGKLKIYIFKSVSGIYFHLVLKMATNSSKSCEGTDFNSNTVTLTISIILC